MPAPPASSASDIELRCLAASCIVVGGIAADLAPARAVLTLMV